MQVVDERTAKTNLFKDLIVGDLFYEVDDEDNSLMMVTEIVKSASGMGDTYNCINLETGWGWCCNDDTEVQKVRGKIVLY